jgi:AcrR family transcriptional regulator
MEVDMAEQSLTTLEYIHLEAKREFSEKGYRSASLRNILKSVGLTTGAFYGYYKSKEELFEALVGKHYDYLINRFKEAQKEFANLPHEQQPKVMSDISGMCMFDMLHYAYQNLEECKLLLCCSEGTRFANFIDEMVEIEMNGTQAYKNVLAKLGHPSPPIDPALEHILITGMFHTFFELIIHEMPLADAENYVEQMRAFYTAGWMKIMGQ